MKATRYRLIVATCAVAALLVCATPAFASDLVIQSVNTSWFPDVTVRVALPPEMSSASNARFTLSENGRRRTVDVSEPGFADTGAIDVVLLLDTSGSMKGKPLAAAKDAARDFVSALGPDDRVAIVGFSEEPKVLAEFTADQDVLFAAIDSAQAKGETAVYDALVRSAALLEGSQADRRHVVLLSDGGDTASNASLDEAVDKVADVDAPVYAVALTSPEYNGKAIKAVAKSTDGTLLKAAEADELVGILGSIAREMQTSWTLSYRSADPPTPDLEIAVAATGAGRKASGLTFVDSPSFLSSELAAWQSITLSPLFKAAGWGIAALIGIAVALLVTGVVALLRREGTAMEQLAHYEQMRKEPLQIGAEQRESAADEQGIRVRLRAAIAQIAGEQGVSADLKRRIERAGLSFRPDEFIYFHILAVVALGVVVRLISDSNLVALAAVIVGVAAPFWYLTWAANRRRARFETALPDIIALIAGSLRAGWGIQQALDLIVEETEEPAASEFRRVQSETRLGLSLEEALNNMADRLGSEDFAWIVAAIGIQREVGGNLAEVLDIAAGTIRERGELRREVVALTAEGRFSAYILIGLPFVMFGSLFFVAPRYLNGMTSSLIGQAMLGFAVLLLAVGAVWLYRVSKVEV